jgi:hypothetical protein
MKLFKIIGNTIGGALFLGALLFLVAMLDSFIN